MRLVIASCSAIYTGRGDTKLDLGIRAIIIKGDGSVSIHNDTGNKPLNYMKCARFVETQEEGQLIWTFDSNKESLRIEISHILSDQTSELIAEDEPGLQRDGTEAHLQAWIADNPEVIGVGYSFIQREFPTGNGPVDILLQNPEGDPVIVEVKRIATLNAVYQLKRYLDALKIDATDANANNHALDFSRVTGVIAALDIRPKTLELAAKRGITTVTVPRSWRDTHPTKSASTS